MPLTGRLPGERDLSAGDLIRWWGDAAWGCPEHVEEAIIYVRSVFIASEELGGLAAYVNR